jgi:hypothetical protein
VTARNDDLRAWLLNATDHDHPLTKAAVRLVCNGGLGDLPEQLVAAIETDPERAQAWIDWNAALDLAGRFSDSARRLIALAASMADGHPVNLADALLGLDTRNGELVTRCLIEALDLNLDLSIPLGISRPTQQGICCP